MSHYDRDVDVLWLELAGFDGSRVRAQETDWGLVETDSETGAVVAVEFWNASVTLPRELLTALPSPGAGTQDEGDLGQHGASVGRTAAESR